MPGQGGGQIFDEDSFFLRDEEEKNISLIVVCDLLRGGVVLFYEGVLETVNFPDKFYKVGGWDYVGCVNVGNGFCRGSIQDLVNDPF